MPLILGDLTDEQIDEFDVAVLSPGVPTDIPMVNSLRDRGVKIWGEIELAYTFGQVRSSLSQEPTERRPLQL